jgi:uncharacterized protein
MLAARLDPAAAQPAETAPPEQAEPQPEPVEPPLEHIPVPESMRAPQRRRRSRRRAPAPADSTSDAIGDFLTSRSGRALQREIVRGVFGLLRKRR